MATPPGVACTRCDRSGPLCTCDCEAVEVEGEVDEGSTIPLSSIGLGDACAIWSPVFMGSKDGGLLIG